MLRTIYILLTFLLTVNCAVGGNHENLASTKYGLMFRSHTVNQDERTTLDLSPEKPFNFQSGFSMSFDLKLQEADLTYGYVFRIIWNELSSFDLVTHLNTEKINYVLSDSGNILKNCEFKCHKDSIANRWMKIRIEVNEEGIRCIVDSTVKSISHPLEKMKNVKISFGKNKYPNFNTTDVAPMAIRDLKLYNSKGELIHYWKMEQHNKNEVYDLINGRRAVVENGIWNIDEHVKWKPCISLPFEEKNVQIACDKEEGIVFMASEKYIYKYDIKTKHIDKIEVKKGRPHIAGGSQLVYDRAGQRLISYSILDDNLVAFDFDKGEWPEHPTEKLAVIQQHNRFIDAESHTLVVFGGYGNHTYHAELAQHELNGEGWKIETIDSVLSPRYLSAVGDIGNGKFLLLGGYGSTSGKQEEFPKNLYDLYSVDYKNLSCQKLAEFPVEEPIVFSNSMVVDSLSKKLYAFKYLNDRFHSSARLFSVDLENFEREYFPDSIPYNFLDAESFCDIFLHKATNNLYSVLLQESTPGSYSVDIYSLSYPPLNWEDILQDNYLREEGGTKRFLYGLSVGIGLGLILFLYFFWKRKTIKSLSGADISSQQDINTLFPKDTIGFSPKDTPGFSPKDVLDLTDKKQSSAIYLLGGLQIFDSKGEEITHKFTPVIRQMFLFILLHFIQTKKGITSERLDETFWPGMDKDSASNNRNVNIRKLRILLKEIGNIALKNEKSYWLLDIGPEVFIDYEEITSLLLADRLSSDFDGKRLERILELAAQGILLPNVITNWSDQYKSEYSGKIINYLLEKSRTAEVQKNLALMQKIADVVLLHDDIDEEAIRLKCIALYKSGQKGLSKSRFEKFKADYYRLLNEYPPFTYEELIKSL